MSRENISDETGHKVNESSPDVTYLPDYFLEKSHSFQVAVHLTGMFVSPINLSHVNHEEHIMKSKRLRQELSLGGRRQKILAAYIAPKTIFTLETLQKKLFLVETLVSFQGSPLSLDPHRSSQAFYFAAIGRWKRISMACDANRFLLCLLLLAVLHSTATLRETYARIPTSSDSVIVKVQVGSYRGCHNSSFLVSSPLRRNATVLNQDKAVPRSVFGGG